MCQILSFGRLPKHDPEVTASDGTWTLKVDRASYKQGAGVGIHMTSLHGEIFKQSFRFDFVASNNEDEYEAFIAGLQLVKAVGAK